jgi:hypothetical protein
MRPNPSTEKDKDWLDEREPTATSKPDDFERALDEDDGIPPEGWKPKPGDMIIGVLRRYQKAESQYGPCWIAVLEARNDAGQPYRAAVWLSSTVLANEFRKLRPKVGERLGVKRLPDHTKGYKRFLVRVDRAANESGPDWDSLGGEGEA